MDGPNENWKFFDATQKWSFPLTISSVNVTKSAGNCGFGHIYWRIPQWKTSFLVHCECFINKKKSEELPGLINFGSCNLHALNSAFKMQLQMQLVGIYIADESIFPNTAQLTSKSRILYHHHWFKCFPTLFLCNLVTLIIFTYDDFQAQF